MRDCNGTQRVPPIIRRSPRPNKKYEQRSEWDPRLIKKKVILSVKNLIKDLILSKKF